MKVKVEKITTNAPTYRTPLKQLDGLPKIPVEGYGLMITSSTHESGSIFTSPLKKVLELNNGWVVYTENSTYRIKDLDNRFTNHEELE